MTSGGTVRIRLLVLLVAVVVVCLVRPIGAELYPTLPSGGGEGEGICYPWAWEAIAGRGPCDTGLLSNGLTCVNHTRRWDPPINACTDWALRNQQTLAIDEPINWVSRVATHNAFNNWADGYPFPNHIGR